MGRLNGLSTSIAVEVGLAQVTLCIWLDWLMKLIITTHLAVIRYVVIATLVPIQLQCIHTSHGGCDAFDGVGRVGAVQILAGLAGGAGRGR